VSWGAHPDVYRGLICSVLEYGCIAFDRIAATHMLKLERMQYRCLRIALVECHLLLKDSHRWYMKLIHMMSIPSHVGVRSNERADQLAGDAVKNAIE
jgi:Mlc titration factor MtfA (ptsG expression regulator)